MSRNVLFALLVAVSGVGLFFALRSPAEDESPGTETAEEADTPEARRRGARAGSRGFGGVDEGYTEASEAPELSAEAQRTIALERFGRRVKITGREGGSVSNETLYDALAVNELRLASCIEKLGGIDRYRAESRRLGRPERTSPFPSLRDGQAQPGQPSDREAGSPFSRESRERMQRRAPMPTAHFDVDANGLVLGDSVRFDPPVPEQFESCFIEQIVDLRLGSVGGAGAELSVPMTGPRRRATETPNNPRRAFDGGMP